MTDSNDLVEIEASVSELIPVASYANVTVGPFRLTRKVPYDQVEEAQAELYAKVEKALENARKGVIDSLGKAKDAAKS